jgi:hypothetical protein
VKSEFSGDPAEIGDLLDDLDVEIDAVRTGVHPMDSVDVVLVHHRWRIR